MAVTLRRAVGVVPALRSDDLAHLDRCAPKDGIVPFDALVDQFMSQHPYRNAQRVFVIIDNGSAHRGKRSIDRLQGTWPN